MKGYAEIHLQRVSCWERLGRLTRERIAKAHPDTGGHPGLVHNWGNPEARAILKASEERWRKIAKRFDAQYAAAIERHKKQIPAK